MVNSIKHNDQRSHNLYGNLFMLIELLQLSNCGTLGPADSYIFLY